jgi:hypothetical protein
MFDLFLEDSSKFWKGRGAQIIQKYLPLLEQGSHTLPNPFVFIYDDNRQNN